MEPKLNVRISYNRIIVLLSVLIAMSSGTFLYAHGLRYMILLLLLIVIVLSNIRGKSILIKKGNIALMYTLFTCDICISALYSEDLSGTVLYAFIYVGCLTFMYIGLNEECYQSIFKWFERIIIIFAISILLSCIFKPLMPRLYFLTSKTVEAIQKDISRGAYAGLAGDRAEAAVLMLVGICLCWAKFSAKNEKIINIIMKLMLFYSALILTSKRTLFVCSLVIPFIVLLMFTNGKRRGILVGIAVIGCAILSYLMTAVPEFYNIIIRLKDTEDLVTMNGRSKLWVVSQKMFRDNIFFGTGFNSFNLLANKAGVRYGGSLRAEWIYQGHNSYLQIMGELGLIGFTLYVLLLLAFVVTVYKLIKRKKQLTQMQYMGVCFSFYIIVVFALYSYTGNCEYYLSQVFLQCIAYTYVASIDYSIKRTKIIENKIKKNGVI